MDKKTRFAADHSHRVSPRTTVTAFRREPQSPRFAANHSHIIYVFVYYVMLIQYYIPAPSCRLRNHTRSALSLA